MGRLAIMAVISLHGLIRHQNQRRSRTGPMPAVRLRITVKAPPMLWLENAIHMAPAASP